MATQSYFFDTINVKEIKQSQGFKDAARIATENEHNLGFREAFRRYPTVVFWVMAISFTIVMEGYDTIPMGNLFALP
jgi:SP family general alpha glucoside:H+ symporter-like MFS transporter